jgi:hypothetical protein
MDIILENNESKELDHLEEMVVNVYDGLPVEIENSIFYPKLKQLLYFEIIRFCKEQTELKEDLLIFRNLVGESLEESQIREYLDTLKAKFNNTNSNVGLNYHIEATRIDLSCVLFVIIKRHDIHMKKFVFRFRKKNLGSNVDGIAPGGLFM